MDSKTNANKTVSGSSTRSNCVCDEPTCSSGNPAIHQSVTQECPPRSSYLPTHICLVCDNNCFTRQPTCTPCDHVFCHDCIHEVVMALRRCPTCAALVFGHELEPFHV